MKWVNVFNDVTYWMKFFDWFMYSLSFSLGHTIGLRHDFSDENGGDSSPCNDKGLMSYGYKRPIAWSQCSKQNFLDHYNHVLNKGTEWCMPGSFLNCKIML